mgnify:CR=1 FL=1
MGFNQGKEQISMEIEQITDRKREYMDMLLLADPQEDMIMKYLDHGGSVCVIRSGAGCYGGGCGTFKPSEM